MGPPRYNPHHFITRWPVDRKLISLRCHRPLSSRRRRHKRPRLLFCRKKGECRCKYLFTSDRLEVRVNRVSRVISSGSLRRNRKYLVFPCSRVGSSGRGARKDFRPVSRSPPCAGGDLDDLIFQWVLHPSLCWHLWDGSRRSPSVSFPRPFFGSGSRRKQNRLRRKTLSPSRG